MKIGIAAPMTLELLDFRGRRPSPLPAGYPFPMTSFLVNALLDRGHHVVAFTTSTGISSPLRYEDDRLAIVVVPQRNRHVARDLFRLERQGLVAAMRQSDVEVINAHWSYEFAWAALDSGLPTVVTLQDHALTVLKYQFDPYRFMRLLMNYNVLRRVSHLTTNSRYLYDRLSAAHKRKAVVIPNFYLARSFADSRDAAVRGNYIITVSNGFGRLKNLGTALRAFALVRERRRDVEFHIVGDGMGAGGVAERFAQKHGLSNGVCFFGALSFPEVVEKVKCAQLVFHPSREESFGMSVLEAMALGTTVVGGKESGNIPFLLDSGRAGLVCDVNSPRDMADSVLSLLADPLRAEEIAARAKRLAADRYSDDVVIPMYERIYSDILTKAKASSA